MSCYVNFFTSTLSRYYIVDRTCYACVYDRYFSYWGDFSFVVQEVPLGYVNAHVTSFALNVFLQKIKALGH